MSHLRADPTIVTIWIQAAPNPVILQIHVAIDPPGRARYPEGMQTQLTIQSRGSGLYEFTRDAAEFVAGAGDGLLTLFCQHTSCSLVIQENADPDVQRDLQAFFRRLVPHANDPSMSYLVHRTEGPDDMPAHVKSALLPNSLSIPIVHGRLQLGTWQGLYLWEHRRRPRPRSVWAHLISE